MLASIRPDSWNLPLFVHVFGAMVLVGGLLVAAASVLVSRGELRLLRVGYLTLLAVALPGYVIMRGGAQWIYSKEHLDDCAERPHLDRDRLHHVRRGRAPPADRPDPRRHRPAAGPRRRHRLPAREPLYLGAPARRLPRRRVGDGREARLSAVQTTTGPTPGDPRSAVRHKRAARLAAAPVAPMMRDWADDVQWESRARPGEPGLPAEGDPARRAGGRDRAIGTPTRGSRSADTYSAARYRSSSHCVTWVRYSSHSPRLSSM